MSLFKGVPGRPKFFESPQELMDYFLLYISDCIDDEKIPNYAGFRGSLYIGRTTILEYEKKSEYKNSFEIISDILEDKTIQDKNIDAGTKKLILQTKFGYTDKQEISGSLEMPNIIISK